MKCRHESYGQYGDVYICDICRGAVDLEIVQLRRQLVSKERRLLIAIKALEFYADEKSWNQMLMCYPPRPVINDVDHGNIASEALDKIKEGE